MKKLLVFPLIVFLPLSTFAASLRCASNLTNKSTSLEVTELVEEVKSFRQDTRVTRQIPQTDFTYAVTTGLTRDLMDDPDEPTYMGRPTLISLVIFNKSKSQVARFDSPLFTPVTAINLTVGSEEEGNAFRIHVVCQLFP
ncbi:hypothetical protein AZI86_16610 [Bdellovibrio bacteriovorus]|uniref:Uncharacterized protein n=1 Tax=Bdellovibrio bacteriovorus TaxID=959 RepID=A0A150WH50_BDEBC|nr:hypothetical protein [Bdellovibrio bacteriovorus]KYG62454.1 hypothetical protein AZI86_16610 [Bdellovibrio bacteriovorus]